MRQAPPFYRLRFTKGGHILSRHRRIERDIKRQYERSARGRYVWSPTVRRLIERIKRSIANDQPAQ